MGQAKIRGTREERAAQSIQRREADAAAIARMRAANARVIDAEVRKMPLLPMAPPVRIMPARPAPSSKARAAAMVLAAMGFGASGCSDRNVKPDLPGACPAQPVNIRTVTERVYVRIPADLTRREEVVDGPLSVCPQVSAERRAAIERLNGRMQEIEAIEGTKPRE
jgi:hypothetical protein